MNFSYEVSVNKYIEHIPAGKVSEILQHIGYDPYTVNDVTVTREFDCDRCEFTGLYTIKMTNGVGGLDDKNRVLHFAGRCFDDLAKEGDVQNGN